MKKLTKDEQLKMAMAIGLVLGFVSICFIFLLVITGRLDTGDKWFDWKDDLMVALGLTVIILMIGAFISFMLSGLEAYSMKDQLRIKELEIELERVKKN